MAKEVLESGTGFTVTPSDPMPETEPGHAGERYRPGKVFDPNAALREKLNIGPGLQDSERANPAHWNDTDQNSGVALVEREIRQLEQQLENAKADLKRLKSGKTWAEAEAESSK